MKAAAVISIAGIAIFAIAATFFAVRSARATVGSGFERVLIPETVRQGISVGDIRYICSWHAEEAEMFMSASAEDALHFDTPKDEDGFYITIRTGTETTRSIFQKTIVRFQANAVIPTPDFNWLCRIERDQETDQYTMKIIRKEKRSLTLRVVLSRSRQHDSC